MEIVDAINELTRSLAKPSLVDYLMLSSTIVYVVVTTIIMCYNINLVKVTKNIQKQNTDLQLFEKRFELMESINSYYEVQFENIYSSMLSLAWEFELRSLSPQEIYEHNLIVKKCSIMFNEEYNNILRVLETTTSECLVLLKNIDTKLYQDKTIHPRDYEGYILKMRTYFKDYQGDYIDSASLEKCLNKIGVGEIFNLFLELESKYRRLENEEYLCLLNQSFKRKHATFLDIE